MLASDDLATRLVEVHQRDVAARNNLWTTYAIACFAAAGFAVSDAGLAAEVRDRVAIGFLVFTAAHLVMMTVATFSIRWIEAELRGIDLATVSIPDLIQKLGRKSHIVFPIIVHVGIDFCVVTLITC